MEIAATCFGILCGFGICAYLERAGTAKIIQAEADKIRAETKRKNHDQT